MANSLTTLDRGRPSALARNRRSTLLEAARQGIAPSFAVVTYKGRNFRLKYRTEEKMVRDERGRPATTVDVVIVGVSPNISRQFFPRAYTEGDSDGPDCYSTDGITPDVGVMHKQNPVCATCKWSQWGSRVTDSGKRAKACQETRRIAVVPLGDIPNELMGGPMLLRIPPMSLNNLSNYSDFLASKGASFETVATRIGFDENVAYPRLSFETLDWLDDDQQVQVTGERGDGGMCASPLIDRMLFEGSVTAPPVQASDPGTQPPEPEPEPAPAPAPEPAEEEDDFAEEDEAEEETPPAKAAVNPFAASAKPATRAAKAGAIAGGQPQALEHPEAPRTRGRPRKPAGNGAAKPAPAAPPAQASMEAEIESALDNLLGE